MHSEGLWGCQEAYDMLLSFSFQPAKWWKQQFGAGVRGIIKEKGCLQFLHLTGNCQLTLTKEGISALAAAFKGSVIRWHYKYRIAHGGGGVRYIRRVNLTILLFHVHVSALYGFIWNKNKPFMHFKLYLKWHKMLFCMFKLRKTKKGGMKKPTADDVLLFL